MWKLFLSQIFTPVSSLWRDIRFVSSQSNDEFFKISFFYSSIGTFVNESIKQRVK